jgi:hypothetical protein
MRKMATPEQFMHTAPSTGPQADSAEVNASADSGDNLKVVVTGIGTTSTGTTISGGPLQVAIPDFDKFAASHPWMGQKVGNLQFIPHGFAQPFQVATAYAVNGGQVFEVHGPILKKYAALGGPTGFLGFPVTNQTATPDGKGQFNHFEHGSVYWHPSLGAFEVHGAIHSKWASLGWERYGYPLTDESSTPDGVGRFNNFRAFMPDGSAADGSIYWSSATGAFEVHGAIRSAWAGIGWEMSFLGFPISDEYSVGKGRRSDFQNGNITWTPGMGAQVQPRRVCVKAPNITFGPGISVGGYGNLEVFPDGTTHMWGHLHDSGFPSYDCLLVFTVKDSDGRAYPATQPGRVHGTDESGSRNLDWDTWGTNDDIRKNWAKIWGTGRGGYKVDVTSDWSAQKIAEDVTAIVGIVLAVIPLVFGGEKKQSSDPNYNPLFEYPVVGEPPPESGIQNIA